MRRLFFALILSCFMTASAFAATDVSKLQLAGDITAAQAQKVIEAALKTAVVQGVPMNIAIVDAGGNLKAFHRMDGAFSWEY